MDYHWLLLLANLIFSVFALESTPILKCHDIKGCNVPLVLSTCFYQCPPEKPKFVFRYVPNSFLILRCKPGVTLSDMDIWTIPVAQKVQRFTVVGCSIPQNISLGAIASQLGLVRVSTLTLTNVTLNPTLTEKNLEKLHDIVNLKLGGLGISDIDENMLRGVPNLKRLNLNNNKIKISQKFFEHVPKLEVLDLGSNKIQNIDPYIFSNLTNLKLLRIEDNDLRYIPAGTFDGLTTLTELDLRYNPIADVHPRSFDGLENLKIIRLQQTNFTIFPGSIFSNVSNIQTIEWTDNVQDINTIPNDLFRDKPHLRTLKLSRNGLSQLPGNIFVRSVHLEYLCFDKNNLTTLPKNIFKGLKNLHTLNLRNNKLQKLPDDIFINNTKLAKLELSMNKFINVTERMLAGLTGLKDLNMEANDLKIIHYDAFRNLHNLKIARFSNNYLTLSETTPAQVFGESPFRYCKSLEELYLADNFIQKIFQDWSLKIVTLRILDLAHNKIAALQVKNLYTLSKNIKVNLSNNEITTVDLNENNLEEMAAQLKYPGEVIYDLNVNPIICDCNLFSFQKFLHGKMHSNVQKLFRFNVDNLKCAQPPDKRYVHVSDLSMVVTFC